MENNQVPTWDISKIEQAQKTFFFERHDGSIVCVQEAEAWALLNNRTKVLGPQHPHPKMIGCSDGTKFQQAMVEAQALYRSGKLEEANARLREGEAAELEAARGHMEMPRNFDSIDRQGMPVNIATLR